MYNDFLIWNLPRQNVHKIILRIDCLNVLNDIFTYAHILLGTRGIQCHKIFCKVGQESKIYITSKSLNPLDFYNAY